MPLAKNNIETSTSVEPGPPTLSFDMLEIPVCRFFTDFTIVYVNDIFCTTLQRSSQDFLGKPLRDHVPTTFHNTLNAIAALTPQEPTTSIRFPVLDAAGEQCWCRWDCKAEFGTNGSLGLITALLRVISEDLDYRGALENLLSIANDPALGYEQRARGILSKSLDYFQTDTVSILRMTDDGAIADAGDFGLDDYGIGDANVLAATAGPLAKNFSDLMRDAGPTVAIHDTGRAGYARHEDYSDLPGSILASQIYLEQDLYGAVIFATHQPRPQPFSPQQRQFCQLVAQWLGFILQQHRIFAELRNRERKYKTIFEFAPVMIYMLDEHRNIIDTNNSWCETLGYTRAEVIGKPIDTFFRQDADSETAPEAVETAANLSRSFIAKDGSIVETLVSTPHTSKTGIPELAVMVDVTERNRILKQLTSIRKTLMQANEGLKRFNTIAAHDLQEPLRKIRLFGSLLKSELTSDDDPEVDIAIEKITDAANRLTTLVKDLLQYSREGERVYQYQTLDTGALLDEVINDLAVMIEETGAKIRIYDLPEIEGDPIPLQRMFTNLILNALKYRHEDRPPELEIFARQCADKKTEIVIRDNGIGLREGEETQIFAPFHRGHSHQISGSGIGLAICKSIIDGHGWAIRAENSEAGGSDFIITLDATPSPKIDVIAPVAPGKG